MKLLLPAALFALLAAAVLLTAGAESHPGECEYVQCEHDKTATPGPSSTPTASPTTQVLVTATATLIPTGTSVSSPTASPTRSISTPTVTPSSTAMVNATMPATCDPTNQQKGCSICVVVHPGYVLETPEWGSARFMSFPQCGGVHAQVAGIISPPQTGTAGLKGE